MPKLAIQAIGSQQERGFEAARQVALVVGASLFVALCAHITIPLPFTPVPLTVQNFGVLLVGLLLGSRRGFAALALYLAEGAMGMPVFSPVGPGGIAHLLGPTGGFLLAYPLVAWLAGFIMEHGRKTFARAAMGGLLGEVVLFTGGPLLVLVCGSDQGDDGCRNCGAVAAPVGRTAVKSTEASGLEFKR